MSGFDKCRFYIRYVLLPATGSAQLKQDVQHLSR